MRVKQNSPQQALQSPDARAAACLQHALTLPARLTTGEMRAALVAASLRAALVAASLAAAAAQSGNPLILNTCLANATAFQSWTQTANLTKLFLLPAGAGTQPMCLDISNFDTNPNAVVWTWPCDDGSGANEEWLVGPSSLTSMQTPATCLAVDGGGAPAVGSVVTTAVCAAADPLQALAYSAATGRIVHTPSGLCVDGGSVVPVAPFCTKDDHATWVFCDPSAGIDARVADIVARMSVDDKIKALGTATPSLPSIGMGAYQWWSEATHGISGPGVSYSAAFPFASNTALPITTSCSFNRSLWTANGNQLSREGRAFQNAGLSGATYWTPV